MLSALEHLRLMRAICEANLAAAQKQLNEMKTESWIKISDRKPTESDLPLIMGAWTEDENSRWAQLYCGEILVCHENWTHWAPQLKVPPPPAKEPTRDEQDREAFVKEFGEDPGFPTRPDNFRERTWHQHRRAWIAAIAYERSEIRHLIERYRNSEIPAPELIRLISARVKL